MNLSFLIFFVFVSIIACIEATFDWTNLDLVNFKYVKYPKTSTAKPIYFHRHGQLYSIRKIPDPPSKLEDTVNRVKAAGKYFKHLAFGNPAEKIESKLILDPEFGQKWSKNYQSKHGKFGDKLVELLGSGTTQNLLDT